MNPAFAASVQGLAEAVIPRVHRNGSNPSDAALLMSVLKFAEWAHVAAKSASDDLGVKMSKMADVGCDSSLGIFSDDLAKAADVLGETVAMLKAAAAEPVQRLPGEWRGTPLHLIGRAVN